MVEKDFWFWPAFGTISFATDIYAIGGLAFYLLTGQSPHDAIRPGLVVHHQGEFSFPLPFYFSDTPISITAIRGARSLGRSSNHRQAQRRDHALALLQSHQDTQATHVK